MGFEYVDKFEDLPVRPPAEEPAPESPNSPDFTELNGAKAEKRRQYGGQTEDPHGEREAQQEHHSARKRGQDNGEFNTRELSEPDWVLDQFNPVIGEIKVYSVCFRTFLNSTSC